MNIIKSERVIMNNNSDSFVSVLGWFATITAIAMYVSYIPQIMNNLDGQKGNPAQPLAAGINCTLWVIYGIKRRDYPIVLANVPGIVFGLIAFFTAL